MPRDADRGVVQRLMADGAQLVEVLPRPEYEEWHLPGALHVPLGKLPGKIDRGGTVVVYCWDDA